MWCDNGAAADFAVVQELIGLVGVVQPDLTVQRAAEMLKRLDAELVAAREERDAALSVEGEKIQAGLTKRWIAAEAALAEARKLLQQCQQDFYEITHSSGDPADPANTDGYAISYRNVAAFLAEPAGEVCDAVKQTREERTNG